MLHTSGPNPYPVGSALYRLQMIAHAASRFRCTYNGAGTPVVLFTWGPHWFSRGGGTHEAAASLVVADLQRLGVDV